MLGDVIEGKGVIEKIERNPELSLKFRVAQNIDAAIMENLWELIKRQAAESTVRTEALWKEVANSMGFDSMAAAHAAGYSFQIDHNEHTLLILRATAAKEGNSK
jgi:hypothetical protein